MNLTAKSLVGALMLTAAAGGAFAQSAYTKATVAQADPFGALPVDPLTFYVSEGSIAALGATAVADLNARCDVVLSWPSYYGWGTAAFCQSVLFAQGLIDDPFAADPSLGSSESSSDSSSSSSSSDSSSASE